MMPVIKKGNIFAPIFIVGAPRSGTTLLAVLLDRHSDITIPPETQFFTEFLPLVQEGNFLTREAKVLKALAFKRIADLQLNPEDVLAIFNNQQNTYPNLFCSILQAYAKKSSKKRVGEKSPKHLSHVPFFLEKFPNAKIIFLIRDGRDVVRSLLKVPWAEPGNRRRFGLFCMEWQDCAEKINYYMQSCPESSIFLVKYEELLTNSEQVVRNICRFIGVHYEPVMLLPNDETSVVPEWEGAWKNKAVEGLDPSRAQSWKCQAPKKQIWEMNMMMGATLRKFGYGDTELSDCPVGMLAILFINKIPYLKPVRPFSLLVLKAFRVFFKRKGTNFPENDE